MDSQKAHREKGRERDTHNEVALTACLFLFFLLFLRNGGKLQEESTLLEGGRRHGTHTYREREHDRVPP